MSRTTDREYRIHRCTACGTAWAFPRPTEQDLADFYGAAYFTADTGFGYGDYDGASWAGVQAVRAWDELHEWASEIEDVSSRRLLDVGAATGEFALRAQASGWEAVACEVGDTAREAARAKGLTAVATIDEAPGHFGIISMYHVLEHLIDPLAVLRLARAAVASDGYLVIELPQWRSAGRIVRRSAWAQFRPPEHINFFSRRSLATTLGFAGWEVVHSSTRPTPMPVRWPWMPRVTAACARRASSPRSGRSASPGSAATCAPSRAPPEPARRHTPMRPAPRGMSRILSSPRQLHASDWLPFRRPMGHSANSLFHKKVDKPAHRRTGVRRRCHPCGRQSPCVMAWRRSLLSWLMTSSGISFGHAAEHSPMLVQPPKPSSSCWVDHADDPGVALRLALRQLAEVGDLGADEEHAGARWGRPRRRRRSRCTRRP